MKTLSSLKMSEFIDMACGKLDVVLEPKEKVEDKELKEYANKLLLDYKMIVNPVGMKAAIVQQKQASFRTAKIYVLRLCQNLISIGSVDDAKEALNEMGMRYGNIPLSELEKKITFEKRRLEFEEKRNKPAEEDVKPQSEKDIRLMFDKEQAAIMTYFKMSIDMNTITASVYANMLAQADAEIRLRQKTLNKMK